MVSSFLVVPSSVMSPALLECQDAIKVCDEECIFFREQGANTCGLYAAYVCMDQPLISWSIVIEGYYRRIAIAFGWKTLDGRIMTGSSFNTSPPFYPLTIPLVLPREETRSHSIMRSSTTRSDLTSPTALMIHFFVQLGTSDPTR